MSKLNLLNKYKEILKTGNEDDRKSSFLNIFKEIERDYILNKEPISEEIAKEIIEIGDYLFSSDFSLKFSADIAKQHNIFKNIYNDLKKVFKKEKDLKDECDEILCNLKVEQVRELESLYKLIDEVLLDKEYKISYKDGLVFSSEFLLTQKDNIANVLEFKSYLAKGLLEGAVFVCDFLDFENDLVLSSGFVFENGKWHPLRENFVKSIHQRDDFKKQEYVSIRKQ